MTLQDKKKNNKTQNKIERLLPSPPVYWRKYHFFSKPVNMLPIITALAKCSFFYLYLSVLTIVQFNEMYILVYDENGDHRNNFFIPTRGPINILFLISNSCAFVWRIGSVTKVV